MKVEDIFSEEATTMAAIASTPFVRPKKKKKKKKKKATKKGTD